MRTLLTTITGSIAIAGYAAAASISLTNADFEASANGVNPDSWTTFEGAGGWIQTTELAANAGTGTAADTLDRDSKVVTFQARDGGYIQQSFQTAEATADTYGSYTVTFDVGFRNTNNTTDQDLLFSIYNVADDTVLGSALFNLDPVGTGGSNNAWTLDGDNVSVVINYDNSNGSLIGDTIALRIESETTGNSFTPTIWVDNVSVQAIPEPSSAALIGLGSLAFILRRRRS